MTPPLLSRKAASQLTGLSVRYLDRLRKDGTLRTYVTKGGHHRFYRDELIQHITDTNFESVVIESKDTVLVDFWAEWCGPCKMIAPVLDEAADTYKGKLQIAKMNVDENRDIPAKFGIRGIPTLMLFKDGQLAATKVGAMSKAQLNEFIQQQLS